MNENSFKSKRVLSIDVLRGFDVLLIIFANRFFRNLNDGVRSSFTEFLSTQFYYPEWFGIKFIQIEMPLFLFVSGVVIPFSLSKRKQESTSMLSIYAKVIKRFIILFILGWIVQGNFLALGSVQFHIFSNALQAIAVGYLFSCIAYIHLNKKWLYFTFVFCLIIYALILITPHVPDVGKSKLLPDHNYALYFDHLVLGRFDDGLQYTWLLTGFGFTATTLSGVFAGELLKSNLPQKKVAIYLFISGIGGLALGLIWGIWHPIIKKIWTSSFVLASSGACYILLAISYWIIDVKRKRKWSFPLKVMGMNAITAYVLYHIIIFYEIADSLLFGLKEYTASYYKITIIIGAFSLLYLLLWYMHKNKTFIKV